MRWFRPLAGPLAGLLLLSACNEPPGPPKPALWEVTGPDGAHGWLFGTTHSLPDDYDWRTPIFEAAFAKAEVLVVEVDITTTPPGPYFEQIAWTPRLGLPSSRVNGPNRIVVSTAFSKAGITEHGLRDTETWAAALILAGEFAYGEPENGVDVALINQRGEKPLVELEGVIPQLRIFDSLSNADQVEMLEVVAAEIGTAQEDGERLATAWRSGDTEALEAEMNTSLMADPELHEALLTRRNRAWAEQLDGMFRKGDSLFVAVGAGHMVGEVGLPTLLGARGFTVKRIQ